MYKTTNLINGKFYIGMHSTNNINDGYLGSGKRLKYSINKYGKENFKLEILEFFDSRSLLTEREKEIVNEDLIKDPNCINLKLGGSGGWSTIDKEDQLKFSKLGNIKHNYLLKNDKEYREYYTNKMSKISKELYENGKFGQFIKKRYNWQGKKHKEETKLKIGETNSKKQNGMNNSQFGTIWITNGTENKKIKKEDIIPIGWKRGRN